MSQARISEEKIAQIRALYAQGLGGREIGRRLGLGESTVRNYKPGNEKSEPVKESHTVEGDQWTISLPKTRICTLEQLVEHCKIDRSIWEVERFICNKWEMGYKDNADEGRVMPLFQVKAFLRKNKSAIASRNLAEEFRNSVAKLAPKCRSIERCMPSKSEELDADTMLEISIVDHHFAAQIWGKETGGKDYDTSIADRLWRKAGTSLIERTRSFCPKKILVVLGNDQQNIDNRQGFTEAGTPQNSDSRYQKVSETSERASIWLIEQCLSVADEVEVVIVPGNHDYASSWHLGEYIKAWYRNCQRVTVDNSPNPKKYHEFGVNMLLLTHGNKGKPEEYDRTMAAEQPAMWGRTKWREAHTAHRHHRRTIELKGATVRVLPSLRPPCAWSADNHFVGSVQAAEGYVWSRTKGLIGTAVYSVTGDEA